MEVAVGRSWPPSACIVALLKLWWIRFFQRRGAMKLRFGMTGSGLSGKSRNFYGVPAASQPMAVAVVGVAGDSAGVLRR